MKDRYFVIPTQEGFAIVDSKCELNVVEVIKTSEEAYDFCDFLNSGWNEYVQS